jgi:hypothetical protein
MLYSDVLPVFFKDIFMTIVNLHRQGLIDTAQKALLKGTLPI